MKKKIKKFKNEEEEREFWTKNSPLDYMDKTIKDVKFSKLKPSTKTISIRFPEWMIQDLKLLANKRDVPYQSLVKIFLSEKIKEEKLVNS